MPRYYSVDILDVSYAGVCMIVECDIIIIEHSCAYTGNNTAASELYK